MQSQKCINGVIRYNELLMYDWVSLDLKIALDFFLKKLSRGSTVYKLQKSVFSVIKSRFALGSSRCVWYERDLRVLKRDCLIFRIVDSVNA